MKRRSVVALVVVALAALAVALPLLASARREGLRDTNDVRGPLDVKKVGFISHRSHPKWRVTTFSRWTAASIWDTGYGLVFLDTFGNGRFDYYALVRSDGYALDGTLWRDRKKKSDRRVAKLHVARADHRSFTVTIPLRKLAIPKARLTYRWYVETIASGGPCPRTCIDRAPDKGAVTEPIPGRKAATTPPPTIIPPVTPSPSAAP